jgi:hypothetical protein
MKGKYIGLLFALVGAFFIVAGLIIITNEMSFKSNGIESVARITDIKTYRSGDDVNYRVYVMYTVNNQVYKQTLNYWDATMTVDKEIKIFYNPNNPSEIIANNASYFALIVPILGGIAFVFGMLMIIHDIKAKNTKLELLKNGEYINAEIEEVIYNTSVTFNRISPFFITCKWKNPDDGNIYLFKSENIWYNPEDTIKQRNITTLPVYINRENLKKYFVSLENLEDSGVDSE